MTATGPVERFHEGMAELCKPFEVFTQRPFLGAIPAVVAIGLRSLQTVVALLDLVYSTFTSLFACDVKPLKDSAGFLMGEALDGLLTNCTFVIPGYGAWHDAEYDTTVEVEDRLEKKDEDGFNPLWLFDAAGKVVWGVTHFALHMFILIVSLGYFREDNFREMKRAVQVMSAGVLDMVPYVKGEDWVGRAKV